nr:ribonuclease H-like domain-containing protein [Tanacetum cinerariifolium]
MPLLEDFPTAREEMFPLLSQRDATAEEVCTAKKLKVIEFGDSYEAPQDESGTGSASESSAKKKGRTFAVTTEDMQKRRNDVKARTTLLLALPDEHQLRFSKYKTAQELWGAILKTFGGNEATKKTKKNQLKQQYGIFNDHHFNKNTANNLPLRGGDSIVDPSCDVLSLGALYSWEFILKFHLHACDLGS